MLLDVAIGMAFTYLLLAILVSGVQEFISNVLKMRGKTLKKGIDSLLCGSGNDTGLLEKIYQHPAIDILRNKQRLPSYIPKASYAVALVDTLVRSYGIAKPLFSGLPEAVSRMPDGPLKHSLGLLIAQAGQSEARLQALIEAQFDTVMDRVSGWYKRKTQCWMLVIAVVLAGALNVDSFLIAGRLAHDENLRRTVVAQAEIQLKASLPATEGAAKPTVKPDEKKPAAGEMAQPQAGTDKTDSKPNKDTKPGATTDAGTTNTDTPAAKISKQMDAMLDSALPIGWPMKDGQLSSNCMNNKGETYDCTLSDLSWWLRILGWLLTAFAVSLGAPYWFDALSRLISLRTAGIKPDSNKREADAAPRADLAMGTLPPYLPPQAAVSPQPAASDPGEPNDFETNRLTSEDIVALQVALNIPAERQRDSITPEMRAAIRNWQAQHGQAQTGQLDEATVIAILYPQGA